MLLRPILEKGWVHSVTCCGHMTEKWLMTKIAKGSGVAGSWKGPGASVWLGCVFHYTTSRVAVSHFDTDPVEDMLYSSGTLFANIVPFLQEKRKEGRKGGREETLTERNKGLWVHVVEKRRAITLTWSFLYFYGIWWPTFQHIKPLRCWVLVTRSQICNTITHLGNVMFTVRRTQ